jgi:hypothetical protein
MGYILSCYYIDAPLDELELQFVRQTLIDPWARFRSGADALVQKRVPLVVPAPDANGGYATDREQRAEQVRPNLRNAGIRADAGRQVVWVMSADTEWDAIFQFAIREETGFGPYVVQRSYAQDGAPVPGQVRVVDTEKLLRGL